MSYEDDRPKQHGFGYVINDAKVPKIWFGNPEKARKALRHAIFVDPYLGQKGSYCVLQYRRMKLAPHLRMEALLESAEQELALEDQLGAEKAIYNYDIDHLKVFYRLSRDLVALAWELSGGVVGAHRIVARYKGAWIRHGAGTAKDTHVVQLHDETFEKVPS